MAHTVEARPWLCPEFALRLITHECPLWYRTEDDLHAMGWHTPYWAFAWPGGQALARYLLDHPDCVRGARVLDLGAGGALEGLAALRAGAASVRALDIDPVASVAATINAERNGVSLRVETRDGLGGAPDGDIDVILLGDMFYDPEFSTRLLGWLRAARARGVEVLLGDPDRGNVPTDAVDELGVYLAPFGTDVRGYDLRPARVARLR
jgi:predicted nicotinamide N-methyase